jgi:hypothetical protein
MSKLDSAVLERNAWNSEAAIGQLFRYSLGNTTLIWWNLLGYNEGIHWHTATAHPWMKLSFWLMDAILLKKSPPPISYTVWRSTWTCHWTVFGVTLINFTPSHSNPLKSILILSSHLHLVLQGGVFSSGIMTKTLSAFFALNVLQWQLTN